MIHPMVVEYVRILHTEDCLYGENGRSIVQGNTPAYKAGDLKEFKQIGVTFCCQEMRWHVDHDFVGFGKPRAPFRNKTAEIYIRTAVPDTDVVIAYCPFCSQPVTTREIGICDNG
jgi:hypothetical protein